MYAFRERTCGMLYLPTHDFLYVDEAMVLTAIRKAFGQRIQTVAEEQVFYQHGRN